MRTRMYLKGNSKTYFIAKKIAYGKLNTCTTARAIEKLKASERRTVKKNIGEKSEWINHEQCCHPLKVLTGMKEIPLKLSDHYFLIVTSLV